MCTRESENRRGSLGYMDKMAFWVDIWGQRTARHGTVQPIPITQGKHSDSILKGDFRSRNIFQCENHSIVAPEIFSGRTSSPDSFSLSFPHLTSPSPPHLTSPHLPPSSPPPTAAPSSADPPPSAASDSTSCLWTSPRRRRRTAPPTDPATPPPARSAASVASAMPVGPLRLGLVLRGR